MQKDALPPGPLLGALINHFAGGDIAASLDPRVVQRAQEWLDQSKLFGEEMERLWSLLEEVVDRSERMPGSERPERTLLNLACGPCREAALLSAFFGRGGRVRQFAMDLREGEIDKAKRRYAHTEKLFAEAGVPGITSTDREERVTFVADDAIHLAGYGEIPASFDTVFIRHQNFWNDRPVWARIFEFALSRIAEDGLLIITSYFDREHMLALEMLKTLGGRIETSIRNPASRRLDYPGKSVDRHIAAITRG